jgi:hypothetical protein
MEGIEQNPVVYDLMAEMAFHNATIDVEVSHYLLIYSHLIFAFAALQWVWYGLVHFFVLCFYGIYRANIREKKIPGSSWALSDPLEETIKSYKSDEEY